VARPRATRLRLISYAATTAMHGVCSAVPAYLVPVPHAACLRVLEQLLAVVVHCLAAEQLLRGAQYALGLRKSCISQGQPRRPINQTPYYQRIA
jgi:hypothetical protein